MGVSSDGILVFGIPLDFEDTMEEDLPFMSGFDDFGDMVAHEAGLPEWRGGMSDDESRKHWEAKRSAESACPVNLVLHCSYEYPMWIIAVRGTEVSASRGMPELIDPELLNVSVDRIEAAKAWCESHDIQWREPRWILCSLYG